VALVVLEGHASVAGGQTLGGAVLGFYPAQAEDTARPDLVSASHGEVIEAFIVIVVQSLGLGQQAAPKQNEAR